MMDMQEFLILCLVGGLAAVWAERFVGGVRLGLAGAMLLLPLRR